MDEPRRRRTDGIGDVVRAHTRSLRNRTEIEASTSCGCFYCLAVFAPTEIVEWCDTEHGRGTTALCPRCGIDSVIGSASGYPIDVEFLRAMQRRWF